MIKIINELSKEEQKLLPLNSIYWKRNKQLKKSGYTQITVFHKSNIAFRKHFYKINFKDY